MKGRLWHRAWETPSLREEARQGRVAYLQQRGLHPDVAGRRQSGVGGTGKAIWATGTNGKDAVRAEVQTDGNFVLYTADKPIWHTDTKGKKDVKLVLQDDRNLVLYAADGAAWSTKTETDAPPPEEPKAQEPEAPAEQAAPAAPAEPAARKYTVVAGDTLWAIAERFYGDGNKYPQIAQASGIANPDLIHPGQELTIP